MYKKIANNPNLPVWQFLFAAMAKKVKKTLAQRNKRTIFAVANGRLPALC